MSKLFKQFINTVLGIFNKKIISVNTPTKSYKDGVKFIHKIANNPDLIIDVGTADGTADLYEIFPYGEYKYLLIEANPKYYNYLDDTKNSFPEDVFVEKVFCSSSEEIIKFNLNKSGYSSSRYSTLGKTETIDVKCKTLDKILEKHGLKDKESILLKIDVEGAELEVLTGAKNTLQKCDVVIIETWINVPGTNSPSSFASVVSFMNDNGFAVFDFFSGSNHKSGVLAHLDTVFVRINSPYRKLM